MDAFFAIGVFSNASRKPVFFRFFPSDRSAFKPEKNGCL
jgi:hypothetical protein